MDNTRVIFKGLDAKAAIEKYDGPLYNALFSRVLEYMCKWQTDNKEDFETMEEWLLMNRIAVISEGELYPKVPLLTVDVAKEMQKDLLELLPNDFSGSKYIENISSKFEDWEDTGHIFISQIILGVMWFNAWIKTSEDPKEPLAIIVTDLDHSPVFSSGLTPLKDNEIISFWQTNQFGHPDTLYDVLKNEAVVKSFESMNDDYTFTAVDNTLVLLNKLKAYKTSTTGSNPLPYISLPKITYLQVKEHKKDLSRLSELFVSNIEMLEKVARKHYKNRPSIQRMVDYTNYRNMVYLVFSYCVVDDYLEKDLLVEGRTAKDTKSKSNSPKWTMI
jgi:hypothetical protein